MSEAQEEADKLRHEAKNRLNSLMKLPEGYSSEETERLVDCIIGAAVLEAVAIINQGLQENELKPCPLCGGRPFLNCFENGANWNGEWEIDCPGCGLSLRTYYILDIGKPKKADSKAFNRELAVTRWNRRVK